MNISTADDSNLVATSAHITDEELQVDLSDGRRLTIPLDWYPRLRHANDQERDNIQLIGGGSGLYWPDIEEDISVESLINGRRSMESERSLQRWRVSRMK